MPRPIDFKALFERSPNAYMLLDRELRYVAANEAYLRTTASRREELIGRNIFDLFPNDPADPNNRSALQLRESFERVLATGAPDSIALIRYRVPQETPEGVSVVDRYWSATHTPLLDEHGQVAFILQHTEDVTELHRLQQEVEAARTEAAPLMEAGVLRRAQVVQEANVTLDQERRHLRRLFEQAPGFVAFLRGKDHVFELANDAYYQVVGHRDIIGKPVREALPEVGGQGFLELLDRVFTTGEPFVGLNVRVRLQRHAGAPLDDRYLDFVYQPIIEPDGRISGIFAQGHDVTEKHLAEEELRKYRAHLEELVTARTRELAAREAELRQAQKMEAVGKLTGGVAHDFNNLLQVIAANLQLLHGDLPHDEPARRRIASALNAVDRGGKLAAQLLAFARKQPLAPTVIHLGQLVRGLEDLVRRPLGADIEVEMVVADDLWNTFADPNQIENVVLNLAINARDAMERQGKLKIELRNVVLGESANPARSDVAPGEYVLLAISDTGAGMPPEIAERAFEPFFTTKPEGRGTGLGLSMVYGFVKQSGGHVELDTEVGRGTTVRIYLPRTHAAVSAREPRPPARIVGGSETILVVEDETELRRAVVEALAGYGYRVLDAPDAQSALDVVRRSDGIDLLFTDVVMPGPLSAPELARQTRALFPEVEVLFTSGYTKDAIVHGGRLDPDVSLLVKPYRQEELAQKLRQMLNRRQQRLAARRSHRPPRPNLRILLVDDDEDVLFAATELLEDLGHDVVGVASAEDAKRALASADFEVLLTDVTLPDESGVELARCALRDRPSLRVVLASGYGDAVLRHGRDLAEAHVLAKPFTANQLERVLAQLS